MSFIATFMVALIIYALFAIAFFYFTPRGTDKNQAYKKFFSALNNVMLQTRDIFEQIEQINLHFKKLSEDNRYVSRELRGPEDLIEQFIHILDTGSREYIKSLCPNIIPNARKKALNLLDYMRITNPFSSLPSREANVMSALDEAVRAKNVDLSKRLILQLAQEIERTDKNLRVQERRNRTAYAVSAMGLVLTTVFGIMSLILAL